MRSRAVKERARSAAQATPYRQLLSSLSFRLTFGLTRMNFNLLVAVSRYQQEARSSSRLPLCRQGQSLHRSPLGQGRHLSLPRGLRERRVGGLTTSTSALIGQKGGERWLSGEDPG